jgi:hypothetical protein
LRNFRSESLLVRLLVSSAAGALAQDCVVASHEIFWGSV